MSTVFRMDPRSSGVDGGRRPLKPGHPGTDPPFVLGGARSFEAMVQNSSKLIQISLNFPPRFFSIPNDLDSRTPGPSLSGRTDGRTNGVLAVFSSARLEPKTLGWEYFRGERKKGASPSPISMSCFRYWMVLVLSFTSFCVAPHTSGEGGRWPSVSSAVVVPNR